MTGKAWLNYTARTLNTLENRSPFIIIIYARYTLTWNIVSTARDLHNCRPKERYRVEVRRELHRIRLAVAAMHEKFVALASEKRLRVILVSAN